MKLSKVIEILDQSVKPYIHSFSQDETNAINLAIGCVKFRMSQTDKWAMSAYTMLPGEDKEDA